MTKSSPLLLVRADASAEVGHGHLLRSCALAEAWMQQGGQTLVLTSESGLKLLSNWQTLDTAVRLISSTPGSLLDAQETAKCAVDLAASWLYLDGYHFGDEYAAALDLGDTRLAVADDFGHASHGKANLLLNQNLVMNQQWYASCSCSTKKLLGPRYVLLRQQFLNKNFRERIPKLSTTKVLLTMGGSAPAEVIAKAITGLEALGRSDLQVICLLGASNAGGAELRQQFANTSFDLEFRSDEQEISELMVWADAAISTGGCTSLELLYAGVPSLLFILAENQQGNALQIDSEGAGISLGYFQSIDEQGVVSGLKKVLDDGDWRIAAIKRGQRLVDGEGAERVIMALRGNALRLSPASQGDCLRYWQWANDPVVRKSSFSPEPIPLEVHRTWFSTKLNDDNCYLYIAKDEHDTPVGQIRFDLVSTEEAEISISIDKEYRGKRFASELFALGRERIFAESSAKRILGLVQADNLPSIRAFERAGFSLDASSTGSDRHCLRFLSFAV